MAEEILTASIRAELNQFRTSMQHATQVVERMAQQSVQAMSQLTAALTRTTTTLQSLGNSSQTAATQMQTMTQSLHASGQAAHTASSAWGTLIQQGLLLAGGLGIATSLSAMVTGLKNMAVGSVEAATQMQALHNAFRALTGSTGAAQAELAFVRQEARRLGLDFVSSARQFQQLTAAARGTSLEGQKTRVVFQAVSEASRTLGLSTEQASGALTAITQIMSKGTVQSEELRGQLGERLPGAFQIAARAMGVTTAELGKILEQGQVLSEDFLPRFAAQLQKELGGGAVAAAQSAQAAFARLGNTLRDLAADVGTSILKILQPAATMLDAFLSKVTQARRANAELSQENVQAALAGTGLTLEQLTATERYRLDVQARQGVSARPGDPNREAVRLDILRDAHERARRAEREGLIAADEELSSSGPSLVPFKKQQEELTKLAKELEQNLKAVTVQTQLFGKSDGLKAGKAALAEVEKTAAKIAEEVAKTPGILASMPPGIAKVVTEAKTLLTSQQKNVESLEKQERAQQKAASAAESAAKQAITDAKQLEEQRQKLINQLVQGESFKLHSPALSDIDADITYFTKLLATETGPRLQAVTIALVKLNEAKQLALGQAPPEVHRELRAIEQALTNTVPALEAIGTAGRLTSAPLGTLSTVLAELQQRAQEFLADRNRVLAPPPEGLMEGLATLAETLATTQTRLQAITASTSEAFAPLPPELHQRAAELGVTFAGLQATLHAIGTDPANFLAMLEPFIRDLSAAQKEVMALEKVTKDFEKNQQDIANILAARGAKATRTRVDDLREAIAKERQLLIAKEATEEQLREHALSGHRDVQQEMTAETEKELEKQAREYERFARRVQDTVASQIFDFMMGRIKTFEDVLDRMKNFFFRILADMAAQALLTPIIIPIVQATTTALGGTVPGAPGGSVGAAGVAGGVLGATQTASSISGVAGGPTATSLIGATQFGQSLTTALNTPLFGTGAIGTAAGGAADATLGTGVGIEAGMSGPTGIAGSGAVGAGTAGAITGGALIAGVGAGVATGFTLKQLNDIVGLTDVLGSRGSSALAGAGGGALAGTIIFPGIGTAIGAALGALGGFLLGGSKERKPPEFRITGTQTPRFGFTQDEGISLQDRVGLSSVGVNLGEAHDDIREGIREQAQQLFESFTATLSQLPKAIQEQAVPHLDQLAEQFGQTFSNVKLKGENIAEHIETLVTEVMPSTFESLFSPFTKLLQKVAPIVQALEQAITELQQRQAAVLAEIHTARRTVSEAHFTPAQLFGARQNALTTLLADFRAASPERKIALIPQVSALAQEVFQRGTAVAQAGGQGGGRSQAEADAQNQAAAERHASTTEVLRGARAGIIDDFATPAQRFEARRRELQGLTATFRSARPEEQRTLLPQVAAMAQEVFRLSQAQEVFGDDRAAVAQIQQQTLTLLTELEQRHAQLAEALVTVVAPAEDASLQLQQDTLAILTELETTTREVFGTAVTQTEAQIDTLIKSLTTQEHTEALMAQAVAHLERLVMGPQVVGSFQTNPGESRRVHTTGLALVHAGETVSRGPTYDTFAPSITIHVEVPPGSDGHAIAAAATPHIRDTIRALERAKRYRQDRFV